MIDAARITGFPLIVAMGAALGLLSLPLPYLCMRNGWSDADMRCLHLTGLLLGWGLLALGLPQGGAVAWLAGCAGYTALMLGGFLRWVVRTGRVA